jgi:hypothetical protein
MADVLDSLYLLFKACKEPELRAVFLLGYLIQLKDVLRGRRLARGDYEDHEDHEDHEDYKLTLAAMDCIRRNLEFVGDKSLRLCFHSLREELGKNGQGD